MFRFLKWFFGLFSSYVNPFERKVDKFFRNIKSTDSVFDIQKELLSLMQENLVIVNVWMEKKYKGYSNLTKKKRRELYANADLIVQKFQAFALDQKVDEVIAAFDFVGVNFMEAYREKLIYIYRIMKFLHPSDMYQYVETASFYKLLRDPNKEKLQGDCNQIVTLYAYLYSLKYPLEDLKIKLLPEHVCLNFQNIDIEATSGEFKKYEESQVLPITEIISTNLLDLNDFREDSEVISSRDMVKSAQLAYAISSLKELVAKNLNVAYRNLAVVSMNSNNFDSAEFYALKCGDASLTRTVYHNAAVYYLNQNNFDKATFYADKIGDKDIVRACYQKRYNQLVAKVEGVKTVEDVKNKAGIYREMLGLAEKMGDGAIEKGIKDTLKNAGL